MIKANLRSKNNEKLLGTIPMKVLKKYLMFLPSFHCDKLLYIIQQHLLLSLRYSLLGFLSVICLLPAICILTIKSVQPFLFVYLKKITEETRTIFSRKVEPEQS